MIKKKETQATEPVGVETSKAPAFTQLINLASERLGAQTIICSDDFFAGMENLIKEGRGIFIPDKYTENGKWMDGWESRRKRTPGNDWCILKLGVPGTINGLDIDTNHFLGNHPPHASIEGCYFENNPSTAELIANQEPWQEILPKSDLKPGSHNFFEIHNEQHFTHLRLNIFPDGGVARFKVYGNVYKNWGLINPEDEIDLAAATNGAQSILCNDMFFSPMQNLLMPGRGKNMGDGWETKRNRTPGNIDWMIIKLAHPGEIKKIIIDTAHFKGNYPDSCMLQGCYFENYNSTLVPKLSLGTRVSGTPGFDVVDGSLDFEKAEWKELLPKSKLAADQEHEFTNKINTIGRISHVKLNIFPDGGISRLRLLGTIK